LRIYRGLAAEQGAWAANALYAMGRLEMDRGHVRTARQLLQRYIDQHPNGANAADARALIARNAQ
jgi:TolA-binding protein